MTHFNSTVSGIPCRVRVTSWERPRAAVIRSDPGRSHPPEGGGAEWEILDRKGLRAAWLEKKLTAADRKRIEQEIFNHMEA